MGSAKRREEGCKYVCLYPTNEELSVVYTY
jgi:hypothetical protein